MSGGEWSSCFVNDGFFLVFGLLYTIFILIIVLDMVRDTVVVVLFCCILSLCEVWRSFCLVWRR